MFETYHDKQEHVPVVTGTARLFLNQEVVMYITNATHFLDEKGLIGPKRGPGRKMADFFGGIIIAATWSGRQDDRPM